MAVILPLLLVPLIVCEAVSKNLWRISAAGGVMLLNMSESDMELLARYTGANDEDAFAQLVRRYLDLVYSAALRQVRALPLAEEVVQSTFIKLARHARQLAPDTVLSAWLYQVTHREAIDVVRREARRRLREEIATEMNALDSTADDWSRIEPLLDEAMQALDDADRTAVLREVGQALGASDDAAQKRVSRAIDRLRQFFAKRGVTISASGLVIAISANAVQAAPAGLVATIAAAAVLAAFSLPASAGLGAIQARRRAGGHHARRDSHFDFKKPSIPSKSGRHSKSSTNH